MDLRTRTRIALGGLVCGAAALVATVSTAGLKSSYPVGIFGLVGSITEAEGSVGTARNSGNSVEYIGCETTVTNVGTSTGTCWAKESTGEVATCTTNNANQLATIRSINPQSWIRFQVGNISGQCAEIQVENGSNIQTAAP